MMQEHNREFEKKLETLVQRGYITRAVSQTGFGRLGESGGHYCSFGQGNEFFCIKVRPRLPVLEGTPGYLGRDLIRTVNRKSQYYQGISVPKEDLIEMIKEAEKQGSSTREYVRERILDSEWSPEPVIYYEKYTRYFKKPTVITVKVRMKGARIFLWRKASLTLKAVSRTKKPYWTEWE